MGVIAWFISDETLSAMDWLCAVRLYFYVHGTTTERLKNIFFYSKTNINPQVLDHLIIFVLDNFLLITDPQSACVYMHWCDIKLHQQLGFTHSFCFTQGAITSGIWTLPKGCNYISHPRNKVRR